MQSSAHQRHRINESVAHHCCKPGGFTTTKCVEHDIVIGNKSTRGAVEGHAPVGEEEKVRSPWLRPIGCRSD